MKSSLYAAYITELIYFPLKITKYNRDNNIGDTLYILTENSILTFNFLISVHIFSSLEKISRQLEVEIRI